jgi:hypothetical protein
MKRQVIESIRKKFDIFVKNLFIPEKAQVLKIERRESQECFFISTFQIFAQKPFDIFDNTERME